MEICNTLCFEQNVQEVVLLEYYLEYQNYFNNFLSGESTDAVCKVWCKWVKLPGRSSKKSGCDISGICEKKNGWQKWAGPI